MEIQPNGRRGGVLGGLLGSLTGALLLTALILGTGAWLVEHRLSQAIESALRQRFFKDPARMDLKRAGVSLWSGTLYAEGIAAKGRTSGEGGWEAGLSRLELAYPWRLALAGKPAPLALRLREPSATLRLSASPPSEDSAPPPPPEGSGLASRLAAAPLSSLSWSGGTMRLQQSGGQPVDIVEVEGAVERVPGTDDVAVRLQGHLATDTNATFSLKASFYAPNPSGQLEGELKLTQLPVPTLAQLAPQDPDIRFESGFLSLSTQFRVNKDWLTASHLVEIKNFHVKVSPDRNEILGVSTKYLKELFKIDQLSFVLPMNGSITDPNIGAASSVEQILLKILEGKFDDKDKAAKWARFGGQRFGRRIDRSFKSWLRGGKG